MVFVSRLPPRRRPELVPGRTESPSRLLVDGVEEPLGELPELGGRRLALLLQTHVVLPQVLHLHLQDRLVLLFLDTKDKDLFCHGHYTEKRSSGAGGVARR